jgi:DNA-binding transcriptional ArsR family regulator
MLAMQRPFVHPAIEDVTLESVLFALADPARLEIVRTLRKGGCPMNCTEAAPGTEVVNTLRCSEIDTKFPGLLPAIMQAADLKG